MSGVERGADGILRYAGLAPSLLHMLRGTVENALIEHPSVFEVAVLGVPDTMMGEKVGAVVVLKPCTAPDAADIRRFALERIADFKVPQFIAFRSEPLPRNPGGKVLKPVLRKETESGPQLPGG